MIAKKKKLIFLAVAAAVLVALVIWIAWGNTALELNTYTISSSKLPQSFDGYRIAHVSVCTHGILYASRAIISAVA